MNTWAFFSFIYLRIQGFSVNCQFQSQQYVIRTFFKILFLLLNIRFYEVVFALVRTVSMHLHYNPNIPKGHIYVYVPFVYLNMVNKDTHIHKTKVIIHAILWRRFFYVSANKDLCQDL